MSGELLRQADVGGFLFLTAVAPNGGVRLLIHPRDSDCGSRVYLFSPAEVRGLRAVLDIVPDAPE